MKNAKFEVDKIICVVRNPLDVYPSFASLIALSSHSQEPSQPWSSFQIWPTLVEWFTNQWREYHDRLRQRAKQTPTFFITYEELICDPVPAVCSLFCFLLDVESVEGTALQARILEVCNSGHQKHEVYKLKQGAGKLYRQAPLYSAAQLALIKQKCISHLLWFDFALLPS